MRILIVEDEVIIAESLYQLLLLLDYMPLEPVTKPEEAIQHISRGEVDVLILDVRLQNGRTGIEVAEYVRQNNLSIPFIFLTAHSDPDTVGKIKRLKPAAYLVKPFTRDSLFVAIEMIDNSPTPPHPMAGETNNDNGELFIKTGTRHERINLNDILYLQAQGKYTELHFAGTKRLLRQSLSGFIDEYPQVQWLRIHKSYAVNPTMVTAITADEVTVSKIKLPIGRFFQPAVEAYYER